MKVLVIGGAGYIGSHVVRTLLDNGYSVTVFDNLSSGSRENLFTDVSFVHGDILNFEQVRVVMEEKYDALIHLAAYKAAGESMIQPHKYALNNISGTINILNAAVSTGVRNIVFSSSAAVYGEPKYLPLDENHPVSPENFYGFTKLEIERLLDWYDKLKNIRFAALRYFNAAGYDIKGRIKGLERNPQNLLPVIMETAAGMRDKILIFGDDYDTPDGTGVRDYVHVNDLAEAHVKALVHISEENRSITLNLGSQNGVSVKEMIGTACKITGVKIPVLTVPRRPGDSAKMIASSETALKVLGWKAKYSDVDTLIESTWKIYKDYKKQSFDHY
ncbi:MAG: UDP-glucose 4-epimerase GalE [Fibrobacter sp.]|mgnify:CR=1 FL=1|nr:UDP-glucose 4-epimerase GalE [Fibrobacter sp.]